MGPVSPKAFCDDGIMLLTGHDQYSMVAIIRECVRKGAAGARTRRCLGSAVDSGGAWNLGRKGAKPDFCLSELSYYYERPWI